MTYLTRIQQLNSANLACLRAHGIALREEGARYIWDAPADFAARNRLLANLAAALYRSGYINGWRDEKLPLLASLHHPARALIERAAAPVLGVCGYGVHANGITNATACRICGLPAARQANLSNRANSTRLPPVASRTVLVSLLTSSKKAAKKRLFP